MMDCSSCSSWFSRLRCSRPHGFLAHVITKVCLGALLFGVVWSIAEKECLPGGNLFGIVILFLCAVCGGKLIGLIQLPTLPPFPPLLGMLLAGLVLRNVPYVTEAVHIDQAWSAALRNIALAIILTRAGLGLDPSALRRLKAVCVRLAVGPCTVEASTVAVMSHFLMGLPWVWGFVLGFVLSAVSPAVVVPSMLLLQKDGYGVKKGIPTLLMAAGSFDDILAITGFTTCLGVAFASDSTWLNVLKGVLEVVGGSAAGLLLGVFICFFPSLDQEELVLRRSAMLLGLSVFAVFGSHVAGFSGAGGLCTLVMAFLAALGWGAEKGPVEAVVGRFWDIFQPLLFGLVGAQITVSTLDPNTVGLGMACLGTGLVIRVLFTFLMVFFGGFNTKEKLFISVAWLPKATVQTAVTELPTNNGPSSRGRSSTRRGTRRKAIWSHGLGRKSWMGKDHGLKLGSIAARSGRSRRRELRGAGTRQGSSTDTGGSPTIFLGGGHTGRLAESGGRPKPTPRAYRKQRGTGRTPCYAVERTVSPVRVQSPVRYIPAPRKCHASAGIETGRMVPAQRVWSPVRLLSPGYPAPALRTVSPERWEGPVRPMPALRLCRAKVGFQPGVWVKSVRTRTPVLPHSPVYPVPPPRTRPPVGLPILVHPVPPPRTRPPVGLPILVHPVPPHRTRPPVGLPILVRPVPPPRTRPPVGLNCPELPEWPGTPASPVSPVPTPRARPLSCLPSLVNPGSVPSDQPGSPASRAQPSPPASRAQPGSPASRAQQGSPASRAQPSPPASRAQPGSPASQAQPSPAASRAQQGSPASRAHPSPPASRAQSASPTRPSARPGAPPKRATSRVEQRPRPAPEPPP